MIVRNFPWETLPSGRVMLTIIRNFLTTVVLVFSHALRYLNICIMITSEELLMFIIRFPFLMTLIDKVTPGDAVDEIMKYIVFHSES